MNNQHDEFWSAIVAAETPSAEELAQAEAGLRELEGAESLPQTQIDAMIAAALNSTGTGMAAPRRSNHRRLQWIAAVLLFSLSLAWVGKLLVWPEGNQAVRTLDYAKAIWVATEPNRSEENRLAALGIIQRDCGYAFQAIRNLCADDVVPSLRDQARQIRDQLIALLTRGADRAPGAADLGLVQATDRVLNAALTIEERQRAFTHLGDLCMQGMRAFTLAELRSTEGNDKRGFWRQRLLRHLTQ